MKSYGIRLLIVFGIITLVGMILFQVFWVKKTYDIRESHFNQTINIALYDVAMRIADYNNSALQGKTPVHQLSSNYFIVEVNDMLDKDILELFLVSEFTKRNIIIDFEYAIYDCHANEMVFGHYVNMKDPEGSMSSDHVFEKCPECTYYFGIHFPGKRYYIISTMNVWLISSIILLSAVVFFGWSLYTVFRQKRLSEIQRDFINNMTHEFRTPISTIAISSEVLMKDDILKDKSKVSNYAAIISEQNNRLKEHVEKVLHVANIEKKRVALELKEIEISELISNIVESFATVIHKNKGTINLNIKHSPIYILADRFHFTNIIVNLLDNAIKYSNDPPNINISLSKENEGLKISISDNGIGIDKRYQKKVFSRFFRVPTGSVHDVKGFGLGLYYVANMVDIHGWKISLASEKYKGSTFIIKIPAKSILV